ncbi:hypothetical protein FEM03_02460 [Phragmitibacter flavus]|uniref:EF-hand domain-containing protein n=1 Tax=Phragmitibacter flavus TaxID=2576071 RepID=A0A5R8KKT6_9BACT|nr:hypothetical protein [Phragmitibacter flavus]TLD72239.1 hypothetical protein FEM03_02460 [Phragmitibacter flavus]
MKKCLYVLLPTFLLVGGWSLFGEVNPRQAAIEKRLAQALKLYPDSDTNKDGVLSINEGMAYLEKHPEVRAKLQAAMGGGGSRSQPPSFIPGAKGIRVFVCGHSYMIFTAGMLPAISKSAGIPYLDAGSQMIGGSQVVQHWNLPDDKNQAKMSLREGLVDVLMLSPNLLMPDEGINNYTKLGLEKNPELRVLVQASWVPRDGNNADFVNSQRDRVTQEQLQQMRDSQNQNWMVALEEQVASLNESIGKPTVFVVPVGEAVLRLRERIARGEAPGLKLQSELFRDDHGHPAPTLALLVSYCHFAAIHQLSPVGLPVPASIRQMPEAKELNGLLQQIAWDTVSTYSFSGVKLGGDSDVSLR